MIFKTTNDDIMTLNSVLSTVTSKGRNGRAVAKFARILHPHGKAYEDDQMNLMNELGGELLENNAVKWPDGTANEANQQFAELRNEEIHIDITELKPFMGSLIDSLMDDVGDLSMGDLMFYDELITQLENLQKEGTNND